MAEPYLGKSRSNLIDARRIAIAGLIVVAVLGIVFFSWNATRGKAPAREAVALPVSSGVGARQSSAGGGRPQALSAEPIFAASFKDFDRKLQPLEQWRGKVFLVYFWATWCKPCRTEVPALIALYEKYRDRDLAIVGIAIDQTDQVRKFAQQYGINYEVLIGGNDALDLTRKMGNGLGGLPFLVVIDRKGNVASTQLGQLTEGFLEQLVGPLLS